MIIADAKILPVYAVDVERREMPVPQKSKC
jgi:hypothetical protein